MWDTPGTADECGTIFGKRRRKAFGLLHHEAIVDTKESGGV